LSPTRPLLLLTLVALALTGCFGHARMVVGDAPARLIAPLEVGPDVDVGDVSHTSVFYDPLAAYGAWREDRELGWIWSPSDASYVPYRDGNWIDTEVGPTWIADEPFGWAVTHYGRWFFRAGEARWYWVPGTEWAPAWVAWRVGEGAVGWAPLAPSGSDWPVPVAAWSFVAAPDFYTRSVAMRRYQPSYAGWFMYRTRPWVRWARWSNPSGEGRFVVGPRVELGGRPLVDRVTLASVPPERLRWIPKWSRPAGERLPRVWASVRWSREDAERLERAAPASPEPPPHKHRLRRHRWPR